MCEPMNEEELANALEARLARFRRHVMQIALGIDVDAQEPAQAAPPPRQRVRPSNGFPYVLLEMFIDRSLLVVERAIERAVAAIVR